VTESPPAARSELPGAILAVASVLPAVIAAAWVAVALPLLALHIYRPVPAIVLGLGLAVLLARPAIRTTRAAATRFGEVPWWALIAILVVVVVAGALAYAHSAEDVLVRRDPGSYAMSGTWLAHHGTIRMPVNAQVFGAPNPHLVLASQGFYLDGSHIIPQFMTGVPVLMSIFGWVAGLSGVLHANAIIGALALLAFGGLAARLVGARWAPIAVLALAFVQPELDVMRATYSEPAGQLILIGGLVVVLDAFVAGELIPGMWPHRPTAEPVAALGAPNSGGAATPRAATGSDDTEPELEPRLAARSLFVGGLVLGLVFTVRIDAVADLCPLVPFVGWLAFHRVIGWRRFAVGILVGLAFGGFDCLVLTYPYAAHVGSDLLDLAVIYAIVVPLTVLGVLIARAVQRGRATDQRSPIIDAQARRWLAIVSATGVFVIGLFFFLRPHLMTMRANPDSGGANYVMQVQRFLHMTVDPTRSYYENATIWLSWYLGWGTLALALLGACWLAYEQIAGRRRAWAPAYLVCLGTAVWVLFAPSITPDHPWADRRFVPAVLPGLVLFAVAAIAPILRFVATRSSRAVFLGAAQGLVGAAAVALIAVPIWFGSRDVMFSQTEKGEPGLVYAVCNQLRPGDVVLTIGGRARTEWPGTLKVMCGVNVGYLDGYSDDAGMAAVNAKVTADGGRLFLLAESTADKNAAQLDANWPSKPTASLVTSEATHTLVTRPGKPTEFLTQMWLGQYQLGGA
jgi:hypothetical protein